MKAMIFTLDSLFSLTIAAVSISILLFFTYLAQVPYPLHYSNAHALLTNLASTSVDSVQSGSDLARAMVSQFMGANATSPQLSGGPLRNGSGPTGPLEPILAFIYTPGNTITTGVVADYGNIYFAANAILYAVNASTNRTVWTRSLGTNAIVSTPALNSGTIFYADSMNNLTALNAKNGALVWSTNTISAFGPIPTAISVYDNKVIFGGTDSGGRMHAYLASNGTSLWAASTVGVPGSVVVLKGGNMEVKTSSNSIATVVQAATTANLLTGASYSVQNGPTNLAGSGSRIYFGTGTSANAIYANGTVVSGFPIATSSSMSGVAVYKNYVVYQTSNTVVAVSPSGSTYWSIAALPSFGSAIATAAPLITSTMVYTLWSSGMAGQNLTTGAFQWFVHMPKVTILPYLTLAYGRIYVVANNRVFAYGSCPVPMHSSLLAAASTLYFNSQPGCGSALLNSIYPMANYTIFAANASSQTARAASFGGVNSYISAKNSGQLNTSYVTVSFWMNETSYNVNGVRPLNYGSNGACAAPNTYCGWFFNQQADGTMQFSAMNANQFTANGPILSLNKWYMVTGIFNGSKVSLYINGGSPYTATMSGVIGITSPNVNLTIGIGGPVDTKYFTGNLANVQIYNKPLSQQQVSQLYLRGAQGVPLKDMGLVAWYPLAGDTNDYVSYNTGFPFNMKFVNKKYISPAFSSTYDVVKSSTLMPLLNYTSGTTNTILVGVYSWSS
jgi:outer membrane protein assembly factor BamB